MNLPETNLYVVFDSEGLPVHATVHPTMAHDHINDALDRGHDEAATWFVRAVYTAPPQRKPLTEEEIEQAYRHIWSNIPENFDHTSMDWIEQGIRYAEQAHGIKGEA